MSRSLLILALAALLAACASHPRPTATRVHVVRAGETAWRISQSYGTTVAELARANRLRDPTALKVGQRLIVPDRDPRSVPAPAERWTRSDPRGRTGKNDFSWPLDGQLTSRYGFRGGAHHDGLDIAAPPGTRIHAAESGRVVHSGNGLSGYGNLIIVKHAGNYSSVYAHNRTNLVRVGEFVDKGEVIGEVGRTGRTSAPHLHFEIRRDGKPLDPLEYLR